MQRSAFNGNGIANRAAYLAPLVAFSSITGGVALILNDLASGRDPRTIYDENNGARLAKFGFQAMVKGGGMGILGDLLNVYESADRDPATNMAGPGLGYAINALQLSQAAGQGDWNRAGNELMQVGKGTMPFNNLWWSKGAVNGLIMNDLHEFVAPGYKRRLKAAAETNYGAGLYIEEGRAPDFGNVTQ